MAARPRTLTLSTTPVIVGAALAWAVERKVHWLAVLAAFLGAVFIQLGTNIQMVGVAEPGMQIVWRGARLALGLAGARLRLAVGFDAGGEIRLARRLIESRAQLSVQRLADSAIKLKDLLAEATCSASTP